MTAYEHAKQGLPIKDFLIIDEHAHMGFSAGNFAPNSTPQGLVDEMDNLGIDIACISHMGALSADYRRGNDQVLEAMAAFPGRYVGYCTINPLYEDDIENELERCFARGMLGVKLHPWCHHRFLSYEPYEKTFAFAARRHSFVMIHTYNEPDVATIDKIAPLYPDAMFIMGHSGGEMPTIEKAVQVIRRHDNVFGDFAVSESMEGLVEWYVRTVGSKKMLFGTDMPSMDGRGNFCRLAMAEISEDEKRDVFGLNMKRIIDRVIT